MMVIPNGDYVASEDYDKEKREHDELKEAMALVMGERDRLWDELRAAKELLKEPFFYRRELVQIEGQIQEEVARIETAKVVATK